MNLRTKLTVVFSGMTPLILICVSFIGYKFAEEQVTKELRSNLMRV